MTQDALFGAEEATATVEELVASHVSAGYCTTTMLFRSSTFLCTEEAAHDGRHVFNGEAGARGLTYGIEDPRTPIVRRIARGEVKSSEKSREVSVVIAHSLAVDPHIDGRLRLTGRGQELLAEEGT